MRPKEEGSEPLNLSVSSPQRRRSEGGGPSNGLMLISPPKASRQLLDSGLHHPQNPEGSIIKDLLLKARQGADMAELLSSEANPALFLEAATSSDSGPAYVCELCRISYRLVNLKTLTMNKTRKKCFIYRNSENLEIHQRYYCKGPPDTLKKSGYVRPESAKLAAAMELAALATPPPFPSPGPLLGSTPLVGGYNEPPATKRPRLSCDERPPSTASLRSLEELSRSPRPMQMFGGKVSLSPLKNYYS
jgi:hypothetical protein